MAGTTQTRTFGRDARGQLVSADLPEVTNTITYTRDALGLARTVFDGLHTLDWTYDGDGRPTEVAEGSHTWKTWTYGATNSGNDKRKGRVTEAVRHNYPPVGEPVEVIERYRYFGGTHGPSEIYRDVRWPNRPESQQYAGTFRTRTPALGHGEAGGPRRRVSDITGPEPRRIAKVANGSE